jgi:hypothetical protein
LIVEEDKVIIDEEDGGDMAVSDNRGILRPSGAVVLFRLGFHSCVGFVIAAGVSLFPILQCPVMLRDKSGPTASHAGRLDHEPVNGAYQFTSELCLGRHMCAVRA